MILPRSQMPLRTIKEVDLSSEEKRIASQELRDSVLYNDLPEMIPRVSERYSSPIIYTIQLTSWSSAVRVLSLFSELASPLGLHPGFLLRLRQIPSHVFTLFSAPIDLISPIWISDEVKIISSTKLHWKLLNLMKPQLHKNAFKLEFKNIL